MILAIDASTKSSSVSVADNNRIISTFSMENKKTHSEDLLKLVDSILNFSEISIRDITKILVSNGPGSFTGLRITLSLVKGLSKGLNAEIYSCSTLRALSYKAMNFGEIVVPAIDARRNTVYTAVYSDDLRNVILEPCQLDIDKLIEFLENKTKGRICVLGDGFQMHSLLFKEKLAERLLSPNIHSSLMNSEGLIHAYFANELEKKDYKELTAFYFNKTLAEREKEEKCK